MKGEVIPVEYFENEIMTLKGNRRVIKWHNALIQDEKGRPVGVISSGDDINIRRFSTFAVGVRCSFLGRGGRMLDLLRCLMS